MFRFASFTPATSKRNPMPLVCEWFAISCKSRATIDVSAAITKLYATKRRTKRGRLANMRLSDRAVLTAAEEMHLLVQWVACAIHCDTSATDRLRKDATYLINTHSEWKDASDALFALTVLTTHCSSSSSSDSAALTLNVLLPRLIRRAGVICMHAVPVCDEFLSESVGGWQNAVRWVESQPVMRDFSSSGGSSSGGGGGFPPFFATRSHPLVHFIHNGRASSHRNISDGRFDDFHIIAQMQRAFAYGISLRDLLRNAPAFHAFNTEILTPLERACNHNYRGDSGTTAVAALPMKLVAAVRRKPEYAPIHTLLRYAAVAFQQSMLVRVLPLGLAESIVSTVRLVEYFSARSGIPYELEAHRVDFVYCRSCLSIKSAINAWSAPPPPPDEAAAAADSSKKRITKRNAFTCAGLTGVYYDGTRRTLMCDRSSPKRKGQRCPQIPLAVIEMPGHVVSFDGRMYSLCAHPDCCILCEIVPGRSRCTEYGYYCMQCNAARSATQERRELRKRKRLRRKRSTTSDDDDDGGG